MTLGLAMAALALAVAALLARPLLARPPAESSRDAYDARIYADQLREIAREEARGALDGAEAEAARREIERRLLQVESRRREESAAAPAPRTAGRNTALALVLAAPALAALLYLRIGAPALPDRPLTARAAAEDEEATRLAASLAALGERLREEPRDLAAWIELSQALSALGRDAEATEALRWAVRVGGGPEIASLYGEALVRAANGVVTEQALDVFLQALAANPEEPRARYYLALADFQAGRREEALAAWRGLAAAAPDDSAWRGAVEARIREALRALGREGEAPLPAVAAKDDAPLRSATVEAMVARLARRLESEPGDVDGWLRLGRSYAVLGHQDKSVAAYERAAAAAPGRPDVLEAYGMALLAAAPGDEVPAPVVDVMARLNAVAPDNPTALWYLGLAAQRGGRREEAGGHWQKLLALLPAEDPRRAQVERALAALTPTR